MSAALSSPASRPDDSLLSAVPPRPLTLVSAGDSHQASQPDNETAGTPNAAMDSSTHLAVSSEQSRPDSAAVVAPGSISEEGSSAHGDSGDSAESADSADIVMEGTAEPEDNPGRDSSENASGEQGMGGTGAENASGGDGTAGANGESRANGNRADEEDDSGDDDAASQASSDYEHRFFLDNFKEDTSVPVEDELSEMERRKADEVSALNQDAWIQQSFTQLNSSSDPEYEILPEVYQLKWTMSPFHGTKESPNRTPFSRSPTVKVVNHDGKEFCFGLKVFPHGNDGTEMLSVYIECFPDGARPHTPSNSSSTNEEDSWWEITAQVGCVAYNPNEPVVHASQKAAHQFTSINPDFGWTRFAGPWTELHKRKHLQSKPLLQNDEIAFIAYIRLIKDSTRALWWHNLHDHKNDWDPVLKTGYRGYHIDIQPLGYSAIISALAVWLEVPAFRSLIESSRIHDACQQPLEPYQTLMMALKKALHDKLAPKSSGASNKITYLDGVHTALLKYGSSALMNPFEVWSKIEMILKSETEEAVRRGHGTENEFKAFFDSLRIIRYSIEPTFPACPDLDEPSDSTQSSMIEDQSSVSAPTSTQGVIALADDNGSSPDILHVELPRQAYDPDRRRWKKVTSKIEIEQVIKFQSTEYQLFGLISHSGELGNLRFNPILRPRGPGTQWLRWSTRCNHTSRGYVVPQTQRQAIDSHQGSGTSSTIAYIAIYVKSETFQAMTEQMTDRQLHDVYNPLPPLLSPTMEEPEHFQVAIHVTDTFSKHQDPLGFIDPWSRKNGDFVIQLAKGSTVLDLRHKIRTLDEFKCKQFGLYRLLLTKPNHRYDPQVTDERYENQVFRSSESVTYGIHFLLHTFSDEHEKTAQAQHEEIAQDEEQDGSRDTDAEAEKIIAERDALYQASLPTPEPITQQLNNSSEAPAPVPTTEAQTAEGTIPPSSSQPNDEDVVMSGTEEAERVSPPPAAASVTQTSPNGQQSEESRTETAHSEDMEQEEKMPEKAEEPAAPPADAPIRSKQLIEALKIEGKGYPVQLISSTSEQGRTLIIRKLNRPMFLEEATSTFAARYAHDPRLHFFNLVYSSDPLLPFSGAQVDKFILQKVESVAEMQTPQKPHNHALVFVKHYYPSKGPALEATSAMLVSRDSILKEVLKRPNSTSEITCYLEQPGEAPTKLRGDLTLADNDIATGCVLITDVVMQDMMATTLTRRGLPSSVTDFLKPKTGFTTGFGRGWASCEMQHGRAHGIGRVIYPNGDAYNGQFISGRRHGKGTMYYASGNSYKGDWRDDEPNGKGVIVYASTLNRYEGPFKDGRPHGGGGVTYWKKAEAGARICRICLDEEMNSVLVPCGHMVVCTACGEQLSDCPVCRTGIDRIQRVWDCSQA